MKKTHVTFFGKIFGSLWDIIKAPFENADKPFLEIAINITNAVKAALNSGAVDLVTSIIPGNVDDDIVKLLRSVLPTIVADELLLKAVGVPTTEADAEFLAKQLVDSFSGMSDERKERFYTSLAADIYIFLQGHKGKKVTFGEAAAFVETAYRAWQASKN